GFFLLFDREFRRFADGVDVSGEAFTDLIFMRHVSDAAAKTAYVLFNPGVSPARATSTVYSSSGSNLGISSTATLGAKGQALVRFDSVSGTPAYIRVQSDRPLAGLQISGKAAEVSALRAVPTGSEARLFFPHFAVNGGFSTIVGVTAAGAGQTLVLSASRSDGRPIGTPVRKLLAANEQLIDSVAALFGIAPGPLETGYLVARGTAAGLVGFTSFRYDDGVNSSAASVPATSIPRKNLLFSHIAHQVAAGAGGNYQTGIALLNPFGVAVPYTIRVFDGAGTKVAEKTDTLGPG